MKGDDYGTHYLGSYYLTENVRVDTNRLEIEELKGTDTDPETITGGYLVQNGSQVDDSSPNDFYTDRGINWASDTPSFDTSDGGFVGGSLKTLPDVICLRSLS